MIWYIHVNSGQIDLKKEPNSIFFDIDNRNCKKIGEFAYKDYIFYKTHLENP